MDSQATPYQVIARKYRPQTFSSVVGQETIVTTLKNAIRFNRLAHAYLFSGCRGTGKTTLARVFAKALNCSCPTKDFEPCNACSSCLDISAGRSLDVLEIDGASNRGIDDIRQINETIGYAPASGKYRIYIIDEVHMLTKEAFNALLKTLEEPPVNVKFFFATTEAHKVLPTIISRCQRFDLNRIAPDALKKKLSWIAQDLHIACEDEVISLIAHLSEGSLRDAESLLDQIICYAEHPITAAKVSQTLGIMPRSAFFSLDEAFEGQNLSFAFDLANEIFSSGKDLSWFIDNLTEHYRCLLKLKLGAPVSLPTARLTGQYQTSASLYSEEQCMYILDFLIHWQQQIGKTPFRRISLEMILLHIIRSKHRLTLPTLIKRLHELEQRLDGPSAPPSLLSPAESPPMKAQTPESTVPARPMEDTLLKKIQERPDELPSMKAQDSASSLEETLMKKIREKIESSPILSPEPVSQSSPLLLSKTQWEERACVTYSGPIETQATEKGDAELPVAKPSPAALPLESSTQSRPKYDTLVRFASVELEGTLKKEQSHG